MHYPSYALSYKQLPRLKRTSHSLPCTRILQGEAPVKDVATEDKGKRNPRTTQKVWGKL